MDYGTLYTSRYKILRAAYAAWRRQCAGQHGCAHYYPDAYYAFTLENESWLEDYALYMALKTANGMKSWTSGPGSTASGSRRRWKLLRQRTRKRSASGSFCSTSSASSGRS